MPFTFSILYVLIFIVVIVITKLSYLLNTNYSFFSYFFLKLPPVYS